MQDRSQDIFAELLSYSDYYIFASSFRGKHPTRFKSNAPTYFKVSYTLRRMHRHDPVIGGLRQKEGWVSWKEEYDISQAAFLHCLKNKMNPELGHTFFFRLGREYSLASLILKPNVTFCTELKDRLALDIIVLSEMLFLKPDIDLDLTETQVHLMMLVAQGLKEKQIAYDLNVSVKTVQNHKRNIERRLNVENFSQAIIKATKAGIFD